MKTKLIPAFLLTAGLLALGAQAQTAAPAADAAAVPAPSRIIYSPRLPSPGELTNVAAAQGIGVEKIDQTATQITVTYKLANGQLNTVAYQLLPSAGSTAQSTAATTVAVPTSPAPTVVYAQASPTVVYTQPYPYSYYYAGDPYYSPWGFYGPLAVGIGLGFGFHGGYYHGGGFYHGHGRW
jgi:hypothetical protein